MNENISILVVDDEVNSTKLLRKILEKKGYTVSEENDSSAALQMMKENSYDIIISDLQMPKVSGLDLLNARPEGSIFIMITGYGSIDTAVSSMKQGAFDYISKPFNIEEFSIKVDKAAGLVRISNQIKNLQSQVEGSYSFNNIIAKSKKMQNIFTLIQKVAKASVSVLIEGPSGTGKELVSRAIHYNSDRHTQPFIAINCSAIPENLLESELFGHTKGAFTGAVESQKGVFEQVNGGTLMLDEIAEMPYNLQSKLLRVLENLEVKPLGSDRIRKVDVRIIAATNQNLKELVKQKKFREDLYYRIATVYIEIPPLNDRREDIPLLVNHFLKSMKTQYGREFSISPQAMEVLINNDWKGNVRELENVLGRAAITSSDDELTAESFKFLRSSEETESQQPSTQGMDLKGIEKMYIKKMLEENKWNKLQVAKLLGIDRKTLYKKIKEYDLE
jgi:two-component system, NtrC family, response regulator AtoC